MITDKEALEKYVQMSTIQQREITNQKTRQQIKEIRVYNEKLYQKYRYIKQVPKYYSINNIYHPRTLLSL